MPSASVTFNKRAKASLNKRGRVVGDYTIRTRSSESSIPGNAVLYNDNLPVNYNDGQIVLYNG